MARRRGQRTLRRKIRRTIAPVAHVLARAGCVSVGTVYVLIGTWAMLALLRLADPAADEQRILHRIVQLPFGAPFIAAVAAGTSGYILCLIFEAVFDPYGFGRTVKGVAERIGIAFSTVAYRTIVAAAARVLLGDGPSNDRRQQHLVGTVLHWPAGPSPSARSPTASSCTSTRCTSTSGKSDVEGRGRCRSRANGDLHDAVPLM